MSVGFRPTRADEEIIQAHKRPDESTSDVLRRALRALDHEAWQERARTDMEAIAASGEDLSDEPDDWGPEADEAPATFHSGSAAARSTILEALSRAYVGSRERLGYPQGSYLYEMKLPQTGSQSGIETLLVEHHESGGPPIRIRNLST